MNPPDLDRSIGAGDAFPGGRSRIWTDVDLDREGKSLGYLRLNYSAHEHASSWVPIPVGVFRNGDGPRILLLGGVHGDEYEGQVLLMKLMRSLDIASVRGHLIILNAVNAPAAYAGRRTSPLDEGNLNRLFPGDPDGSPTEQIAHYIECELLPRVDYLLDFHSGGDSLQFIPSAHVYHSDDAAKLEHLLDLLRAFGMPTSIILKGMMGMDRKIIGACERTNVLRFSTELGGGGGITLDALRRAEAGLARLLETLGALRAPLTDEPAPPISLMARLPNRTYVYAMATGLFEPFVALGEAVVKGQPAGAIHFPQEPWREPDIVRFSETGTVYAIRPLARTILGDALFMLAIPWENPS